MNSSPSTFKHILVATDFGDPSARALEMGLSIAAKFDADVTILHSSWMPPMASAYAEGLAWPVDAFDEAARRELDKTFEGAKAIYPKVQALLMSGEPTQMILDAVRGQHADLLIMGTHGRHGLARVLMGSVAEKIVRQSPVPVLTVGPKRA